MIDLLTAPYPFRRNQRVELLFVLGAGAFVALFLIYFQPFGTERFDSPHKNWFLAGYGAVVSGALLFFRNLIPALYPAPFEDENWTVGRHILWAFLSFIVAVTACYGYWAWYFEVPFRWPQFWGFFRLAFSIAIFPIAAFVVADYIYWLRRFQHGAEAATAGLEARPAHRQQPELVLRGENEGEQLSLSPADLLFIRAADNYVEVFLQKENEPERFVLRGTLKSMETQLPSPPFARCHRSYLVNLDRVREVTGNAQGYRLHLAGSEETVPVSRSRSEQTLSRLSL